MVNFDYLYNPEAAKAHFAVNHFLEKKLDFKVIENGTILPYKRVPTTSKNFWQHHRGGIVNNKNEFVLESYVHYGVGGVYTPPPESIQHSSETVVYLGFFYPVWGHVLTDNIRRIWFLKSEFMNQFKNCPLVYINWKNTPLEEQRDFRRLLEILGVNFDKLQLITQPTQFEKIILPDESYILDSTDWARRFTNEYRETVDVLRNFALKNRTPISNKKLYFYYGGWHIGEKRLAEYFKSKGYEIITHEQRSASFDEELNLMINAESFASPLGSVAHNSVFLRDGTETIFIPRSAIPYALTSYQQVIDQVSSLNANYIDSTLSVFNMGHDSFCFIISKQLKEFFGDKWNGYEKGDFKTFLDYVNSPSRQGRTITPDELKVYDSVFTDFMAQLKQQKDLIATYNMRPDWDKFKEYLTYVTWIHKKFLSDSWKKDNQPSNPLDQELEVLAIQIRYPVHKVYYSVYYNEEEGWTNEVSNGEWAGVTNRQKPIYGMKIRLGEAGAKERDILYRMHKFDGTWTPWAKNGEALYSHGQKVNAIQMKLEPINIQPDETETEEFDDMYSPWVENDVTIYLQGQRDLIRAKTIKTQPDKTRTNEFDDVYTPWTKSDATIYLQGQRVRRRAKIKKDVI